VRAFVALDLPETLVEPITRLQAGLSIGRAVPEDNLHLTLAFLGDIAEADAAALADLMQTIAMPPIPLCLKGLDIFGGRRPAVLSVMASGDGLVRLHDKIAHLAREAGIQLARERFRPHVTIARFRREMSPREHQRLGEFLALNGTFALDAAPADTVTFYRSHLREAGAIHEPLAQCVLRG